MTTLRLAAAPFALAPTAQVMKFSPAFVNCGHVIRATAIRVMGDDLSLVKIETTTHWLDVWWDSSVSLPHAGAEVLRTHRGDLVKVHSVNSSRTAKVAKRDCIEPDGAANACRWALSIILEWMAERCEAFRLVPLARGLIRRAERIGYRSLSGVMPKGEACEVVGGG